MHSNKQNPVEVIGAGDIGAGVGFKDIHTGKIEDIMLVKTSADIEKFKEMYGIEGNIDKEY